MTTAAPNLGNILDADLINPIKSFFGTLLTDGLDEAKTLAQTALGQLSTVETNAAAALTAAQSQVDAYINPLVDTALKAGAAAVDASVPGLAAIVNAAEPNVETAANGATDAFLLQVISTAASLLTQAAKTTAAVNLSNLAGASS